jgi:hypothetical protein
MYVAGENSKSVMFEMLQMRWPPNVGGTYLILANGVEQAPVVEGYDKICHEEVTTSILKV